LTIRDYITKKIEIKKNVKKCLLKSVLLRCISVAFYRHRYQIRIFILTSIWVTVVVNR
jgi:hypothetical protein